MKHPNKSETIEIMSAMMAKQANAVLGSDDCPPGAYLPEAEEIYDAMAAAGALYESRSGKTIPRAERRRRKAESALVPDRLTEWRFSKGM